MPRGVLCGIIPRTVLHSIRAGDLKWNGPREGLVKCLLSRNRWYFAFCLTIPPEIVMSSVRTQMIFLSGQQLLGNDRREPAQHVVFAIDDDDLRDACSIAVPGKKKSGSK
mmetsp:Transcript_463/g.3443  ORF Transcript_463/g.3443 Transcript_463/m.3443 type:complete len:110 (-) Transcript_463:286-615(-)